MSFESFENAAGGFRDFLSSSNWPASIRWLTKSNARWNRSGLHIYRPELLTDTSPHQLRFDRAIKLNKNIAFIAYGTFDGHSMVGLETTGIDPPHDKFEESGSHNYKTLESPLRLIAVDSRISWLFTQLLVRNNDPMWNSIGWPE